jgi:beta-glucosidase
MQRPLVRYNPIKPFNAREEQPMGSALAIEEPVVLDTEVDSNITLHVTKAGQYQVSMNASYDRDELAQSSCSLHLNGDYSMSLSTNGTEGKAVDVEGLIVELQTGWYELDVSFVKPGLTLHHLNFKQV